jgi:hypothetical protein
MVGRARGDLDVSGQTRTLVAQEPDATATCPESVHGHTEHSLTMDPKEWLRPKLPDRRGTFVERRGSRRVLSGA